MMLTDHIPQALLLRNRFSVITSSSFEILCQVRHRLRFLSKLIQRFNRALGDHCSCLVSNVPRFRE